MDRQILELATSLLEGQEASKYQQLLVSLETNRDSTHGALLSDILSQFKSSYLPLIALHAICCKRARPWPAFALCRQFWQCWRALPEAAKAGRGPDRAHVVIHKALAFVNNSYSSFHSLLHPSSTAAAIINPDTGSAIAHDALAQLLNTFSLPVSTTRKPVVAISLPNGPLLAVTLLATATYYTAAPIAYGSGVGVEQFKRDVLQSGSNLVLAWSADVDRLKLRDAWLDQARIKVLLVELSIDNHLIFRNLEQRQIDTTTWPRSKPNHAGDIAVLLFTSGTSGSKKLVPLHVETLVTGVAMVQSSWGLSPASRCLNQMPLNHVGGIVRNLFAPIMSGGSVICCSGFDANAFWDAVDDHAPTWYYASPTMHQCILEAAADRSETIAKSQISLICNAAGGLLPSLAVQLRDTFSRPGLECTVLPSYGMTECMPISTPALSYKLEKTGTSGVSVGPEIAILDGQDQHMRSGGIGRIAVRGAPVFAGYLKDGHLDRMCFTKDAWFDTGDMGYLDGDGFLYITGRSKEVINRGGELISPFEVEDAVLAAAKDPNSPIFETVTKTLAFSVNHDVLQEVVGLIVVTPADKRRPCLKTIQEATKSSLASVKVPVLLVYMNDGVPTNNNKVLRIRLAERLNIPIQSDSTPQQQRYYEAICPEPNTPLTSDIRSRPLPLSTRSLQTSCNSHIPATMDFFIRILPTEIHPELWLAPKAQASKRVTWIVNAAERLREKLALDLDAYFVPSRVEYKASPFVRRADGSVNVEALLPPPAPTQPTTWQGPSQTQTKVGIAFAETLGLQAHTMGEKSDFFELGGDSMKAGRLLSALRKTFNMRLTIEALFKNSTVGALARLIDEKGPTVPSSKPKQANDGLIKSLPGCTKTCSSTNPFLLALQLVPICIVAPLRRALTWTMFIYCLTFSQRLLTSDSLPGRFINLVISLLIGKIFAETIAPLFAILCKWLIIGRYQEGMYPMWSSYHTRWWLVQKIISIGGLGIYEHFGFTRILYYKALGVSIGRNVSIDKEAKLGEYDLISIGDGVILDACVVRPFAAERNTSMYLGRIRIGMGSSVGLASVVAAGTTIPSNTCIGPNSSSWELEDAVGTNRNLSPTKIRQPGAVLTYFVGLPVVVTAAFIGAIPWMGGLFPLILTEPKQNTADLLRETIIWFAGPSRVAWHYVALACNAAIGPLFFFAAVIGVKRVLDSICGGPAQPGPSKEQSQLMLLRSLMMRTLMPDKQFHRVTALFGTHYESSSFFARQLGSKIGKHVYWPGKGPTTQDWDMLEIEDSVVFGSRSHILTSDATGTSRVKIGKGAMVADRVVLLPGSELGRNTIMGSGALAKAHKTYPDDTTWVGSKAGDAICLKAEAIDDPETEPALGSRFRQYRNTIDGRDSMYRRPYRDTIDAQVSLYNYMNDSQTTIRKTPFDSRMSSMYDLEVYSEDTLGNEKSLAKEASTAVTAISPVPNHDESSPFGRAFYQGKASYRVWGQFGIFCYSTFLTVLTATFWNMHSISAIQIVAYVYRHPSWYGQFLQASAYRPFVIYIFFSGLIAGIFAVQIMFVLGVIIAAKWILMGRRKQGNYDWDKSPYCQRWQLLLKIEALRQKCYGGHGILGLLTGTNWVVQYFRALGANIGNDCALFASGTPSLYFTEPDLLTIGDRVSVDDASLVCHINTRGKFDLNPLVVGDRSVLRTGSRLLSGARMEADSCLLEHTLVMAGDIVDAETARQGWPGEEFDGNRLPTLRVAYYWETA